MNVSDFMGQEMQAQVRAGSSHSGREPASPGKGQDTLSHLEMVGPGAEEGLRWGGPSPTFQAGRVPTAAKHVPSHPPDKEPALLKHSTFFLLANVVNLCVYIRVVNGVTTITLSVLK